MLVKRTFDNQLDLADWVGQRSATFTFTLINAVTGEHLGEINPIRGSAVLSHDTSRTIKRQLNMNLGLVDTARIDPISNRVDVAMVVSGVSYPLGRYIFTDFQREVFTSG